MKKGKEAHAKARGSVLVPLRETIRNRLYGGRLSAVAAALLLAAAGACGAAPQGETGGLKSLSVRTTEGWGGELVPAFSPDIRSYTVSVAGDCLGIEVSAVAAPGGRVAVNGRKADSLSPVVVVPPVGKFAFPVAGFGPSGAKTTYRITVVREDLRPTAKKFLRLRYEDGETGLSMTYRLFVPEGADGAEGAAGGEGGKRYPLVLYLHGAGELDTDDNALLVGNQGPAVWARPEEQAKRPCFILAPHCSRSSGGRGPGAPLGWTSLMKYGPAASGGRTPFEPTDLLAIAYRILEKVSAEYAVDADRIYLTGLSMGGFGSWAMALSHPDTFAALVPICGGGDPARLGRIAKLPIWVFHGEADPVVPVQVSRASVAALKAAGGLPRYTEYPHDAFFLPNAHFSWVPAYADEEMREWLFAQRR